MGACCDPRASKPKNIEIGGHTVGILGLEQAMQDVYALGLPEEQLGGELLKRIEQGNYVPSTARGAYEQALVAEYKQFIAQLKKEGPMPTGKVNIIVLGIGCSNCRALEKSVQKVVQELAVDAVVEKIEDPRKIVEMGVLSSPGLVVNGKLKSAGKVPKPADIAKWIKEVV